MLPYPAENSKLPTRGCLLLCLLLALSLLSFATPSAAGTSIVVGGDHYYPPYEFLDKEGTPAGYNVELTRAIAEVMGIEVEIRLEDWDDMRHGLVEGTVDILQGMVHSEGRSEHFDFSPPHAIVHESAFARRGAPRVNTLEGLRGKEVIVQKGGAMHDYLREKEVGAKLVLVDTHTAALRLLASGKHDYALVGNLPGLYLGKEFRLSNIVPVGKLFAGLRYGYAVRKGDAELLAIFSEGLAILKNTGRQQEIYDKWLGALEQKGIPWKRILQLGGIFFGPFFLVLAAVVIWNRSLKREVALRSEELQLHQQQLIQADKMASLGILVSGMAHEINNPNSVALLNMPIVLEAYEDCQEILEGHYREHGDFAMGGLDYSTMREEVPHMLSEMLDGAGRIKRIVEDLKDFARQGNASLEEDVKINAVVGTAVRLVDNSIRTATSRFEEDYAEALPTVPGNAQRIEQVVINLILNACQALESPEEGISLSTRHDQGRGVVIFEVRDEGCGIAPEHLSHLTDPFFTTKRESGGTGLGLSVSATIVQQHGGTLEFGSVLGKGTTAVLSLPVFRKDSLS